MKKHLSLIRSGLFFNTNLSTIFPVGRLIINLEQMVTVSYGEGLSELIGTA